MTLFNAPGGLEDLKRDAAQFDADDLLLTFWGRKGAAYSFAGWYQTTPAVFRAMLNAPLPGPAPAPIQTGVTTALVNVRTLPAGVYLTQLKAGVAITLTSDAPVVKAYVGTTYTWRKISAPVSGWLADAFIRINMPPVVTKWKIGLHALGKMGREQGAEDVAIACRAKGHPLPAVTVALNPLLAVRIKTFSPETFVVARHFTLPIEYNPPSFGWDTRILLDAFLPELTPAIGIVDALQLANEWLPGIKRDATQDQIDDYVAFYERFCQFYYDLAGLCNRQGIRCTIGDFAVGHPALWIPAVEKMTFDLLDATCSALGHVANYHCYSPYTSVNPHGNDSILVDKENWAAHWVKMRRPGVKWVLGELGYGDAALISLEKQAQLIREAQEMLGQYDDVIGACLWTFGGAGNNWDKSELFPIAAQLVDLLSVSV